MGKMKSRLKRFVVWCMVVACFICSANIQTTTVDASTTKKVSISKSSLKLKTKVKYKLKVNGTTKKVVWKSSNKKVAKVSQSGLVKAIKPGKTVVSAKVGKKTYKCTVRVYAGSFKHKHKYKEKIEAYETYLILDPAIYPTDTYSIWGSDLEPEKRVGSGYAFTTEDVPENYFNYGTNGQIIYKGIYCRGKLIDKTHFRRATLKAGEFDNVGKISLVTGNNNRIIDLSKLDWYCIHNQTWSYNECVYCGKTDKIYNSHDAHTTVSWDGEDEKKYFNPHCTCREFVARQYGRCFLWPVESVEKEGHIITVHYGITKIKFSRCKHENGLDYYYTTMMKDLNDDKEPSEDDSVNRYKCRDCGAILRKSDLR